MSAISLPHDDILVPVKLGDRSYQILISNDSSEQSVGAFARSRNPSGLAFVVADGGATAHLEPLKNSLLQAGYRVECAILAPGEGQNRSLRRPHFTKNCWI